MSGATIAEAPLTSLAKRAANRMVHEIVSPSSGALTRPSPRRPAQAAHLTLPRTGAPPVLWGEARDARRGGAGDPPRPRPSHPSVPNSAPTVGGARGFPNPQTPTPA